MESADNFYRRRGPDSLSYGFQWAREELSRLFARLSSDRVPLVWALWGLFNVAASVRFRFWINSDTVGSIDSARALQSLDIPNFINAYWGTGLALFLSLLPLERPSSWVTVHLVVGTLLFLSQLFLYSVVRRNGASRWQATGTAMAWGLSCYATGSAVFVTAEPVLCFFAAAYLFLAFRTPWHEARIPYWSAAGLGLLHGLAGMTKTIAFPTLLIFPTVCVFLDVVSTFREGLQGAKMLQTFRKWSLFLLCYGSLLLVLLIPWGMLTKAKYGRFTLGDSASYNLAKFTRGEEEILSAEWNARYDLPTWGSYWWSDLALTVERSDRSIEFDLPAQVNRMIYNAELFLSGGRHLRDGWPSLLLIVLAFAAMLISWRCWERTVAIAFGCVAVATVFAYLGSVFLCRYFPYATLLAIPMAALFLNRLSGPMTGKLATGFLWLWTLHGLGATLAAFGIAPGSEIFEAAQLIARKTDGPIAVVCEPGISYAHYGGVALVAGRQAAEAHRVSEEAFKAEFEPGVVLWLSRNVQTLPEQLRLNSEVFAKVRIWRHEGGSQPARWFAVYLPLPPSRPNQSPFKSLYSPLANTPSRDL